MIVILTVIPICNCTCSLEWNISGISGIGLSSPLPSRRRRLAISRQQSVPADHCKQRYNCYLTTVSLTSLSSFTSNFIFNKSISSLCRSLPLVCFNFTEKLFSKTNSKSITKRFFCLKDNGGDHAQSLNNISNLYSIILIVYRVRVVINCVCYLN